MSNLNNELYKWKYLDISDLDNYPDAIHDIYCREYHGLIIKNVFTIAECDIMLDHINNLDRKIMIPTTGGHSYPKIFAQVMRPADKSEVTRETLKNYFSECSNLPNHLSDLLNVDVTKKIEEIFQKLSGGREVIIPDGYDGEGKYANTSIRVNYGGKGYISVHSGNYFQQEFSGFYEHLSTQVNIKDQLSYFVTVNPASIGGELTLYETMWEPGQTKTNAHVDDEIILPDGKVLDASSNSDLKRMKVKPSKGDLLIFLGGPIWHRVEKVEGPDSRVTIGGFLSFTDDKKRIVYWS